MKHFVQIHRSVVVCVVGVFWGCGGTVTQGDAANGTTSAATGAGGTTPVKSLMGGSSSVGGVVSVGGTKALNSSSAAGGVFAAGATLASGGIQGTSDASIGLDADASTCTSTDAECIIRVAKNGTDANNGSSWAMALASVQEGLDVASALVSEGACCRVEVWVAAGTYAPTELADLADARTATFQLVTNVDLLGGFAGTESLRSERNIAHNVTILSGDIGAASDASDNSYHVVTGVTGATLDGFSITGGNADGDPTTSPKNANIGGGMLNSGASPTVINCTFADNVGSAIYNESSSPTITSCAFTGNRGPFLQGGGGIFNRDSSPTVTNCRFTGGGVANRGGAPKFTNCAFIDNFADGWGLAGYGGNHLGGGMYNSDSSPIVTNCTFTDNEADEGAGMYNDGGSPIVTNCTFAGNSAHYYGGGMSNRGSSSIVTNCTFTNNSTRWAGGGMDNDGGSSVVTNCIFWNDSAETSDVEHFDGSLVSYSIVQAGYAAGTNIITADPLFVDATNGDFRLRAGSPAIDVGNGCADRVTPDDLAGNGRWDIANVANAVNGADIGAFEYQGVVGVDALVTFASCD